MKLEFNRFRLEFETFSGDEAFSFFLSGSGYEAFVSWSRRGPHLPKQPLLVERPNEREIVIYAWRLMIEAGKQRPRQRPAWLDEPTPDNSAQGLAANTNTETFDKAA